MGKYFLRPFTSTRGLFTAIFLPVEKAGHKVARRDLRERRRDSITRIESMGTSGIKFTAGRRVTQIRDGTGDDSQNFPFLINSWDRSPEPFGIGMFGIFKDFFHSCLFDDGTCIHHSDPVTYLNNNPQIMSDEQNR
jgi:hypothetical protein